MPADRSQKPRRISTDRARCFCQALPADSEGLRSAPWWSSIHTIASRLRFPYDEAVALADDGTQSGLVTNDPPQYTKASRRALELPHSVTLNEAGRRLAKASD